MIEDLKVLKDISVANNVYALTGRRNIDEYFRTTLQQQAQKWIVYLTKETQQMFEKNYFQKNNDVLRNEGKIEWIKQFFNIAQEEKK